jgi:hypothetical protein
VVNGVCSRFVLEQITPKKSLKALPYMALSFRTKASVSQDKNPYPRTIRVKGTLLLAPMVFCSRFVLKKIIQKIGFKSLPSIALSFRTNASVSPDKNPRIPRQKPPYPPTIHF